MTSLHIGRSCSTICVCLINTEASSSISEKRISTQSATSTFQPKTVSCFSPRRTTSSTSPINYLSQLLNHISPN